MNQADAQRIRGILSEIGFVETQKETEADLILFNTCSVREHAEQRLISRVQALTALKRKRGNLLVGIAGCMAQNHQSSLFSMTPLIDLVFGPNDLESLPELLQNASRGQTAGKFLQKGSFNGEEADGIILERPFSAFVNIIRGCTNFCSYCIVPSVRGPEVSRPPEEILKFVDALARRDVVEVTLLGQNVNAYGRDLGLEEGFVSLLESLQKLEKLRWIRFLTSHPRDFTFPAIDRISRLSKVCEQFHLPVQAGSDRILGLMNRGYDRSGYLKLVAQFRSAIPLATISTDIICGFPSETETEFEETLQLVREVRFESAYMYYFSPRPGTRAAGLLGQLPEETRKHRLARLIETQNQIAWEESQKLVGKTLEVLVERTSDRTPGHLLGKTRAGRTVDFAGQNTFSGSIQKVRIDRARSWTLSGTLLDTLPVYHLNNPREA